MCMIERLIYYCTLSLRMRCIYAEGWRPLDWSAVNLACSAPQIIKRSTTIIYHYDYSNSITPHQGILTSITTSAMEYALDDIHAGSLSSVMKFMYAGPTLSDTCTNVPNMSHSCTWSPMTITTIYCGQGSSTSVHHSNGQPNVGGLYAPP